jgi:hypothetical protein
MAADAIPFQIRLSAVPIRKHFRGHRLDCFREYLCNEILHHIRRLLFLHIVFYLEVCRQLLNPPDLSGRGAVVRQAKYFLGTDSEAPVLRQEEQ